MHLGSNHWRLLSLGLLVPLLMIALLATSIGQALAAPYIAGAWSPMSITGTGNALQKVIAISSSDIWAVGSASGTQAFIEHDTGNGFAPVSTPATGFAVNHLFGVSANSASDVWAVGSVSPGGHYPASNTLIEHYDGSVWSIVTSPNLGIKSMLSGVVALAPDNVWSVGSYQMTSTVSQQPLIEHYNGSTWSIVSAPTNLFGCLVDIAAVDASNIKAVGDSGNSDLVLSYDGTKWSVDTTPPPVIGREMLTSITHLPNSTQYVAAGWMNLPAPDPSGSSSSYTGSQILNYNGTGTTWSRVTAPSGPHGDFLYGIDAVSATDIWAVGNQQDISFSMQTLTLHYDGTSWSITAPYSPSGLMNNTFNSIVHNGTTMYTVGNALSSTTFQSQLQAVEMDN